MLKRNPVLKQRWLTRVLASTVISGALMSSRDWKSMRLAGFIFLPGSVALSLIMIITLDEWGRGDYLVWALITLSVPVISVIIYLLYFGYTRRDELDTKGGVRLGYYKFFRPYFWWIK